MEILAPDAPLPTLYSRRPETIAEQTRYIARPGLRALPSGSLTVGAFIGMQTTALVILIWAIWWPWPSSRSDYLLDSGLTMILLLAVVIVAVMLLRRHPGFLLAVLRAPFIRLTVTDRRILWNLPWTPHPLLEIGRERILGGVVGSVDKRGTGSAAVILIPGDPCADIDGAIHFDRLPQVLRFVSSLG